MKIVEVTNVDFSLVQFVLPLMRAARERGHQAIGVCADGPLLERVRAEGFRVLPVPMARRAAPAAQFRALREMARVLRAERPDLVHAHMPISGLIARVAARMAGAPRVAYTCHGYLFNQPSPAPRRATSLALEWAAGRLTDTYLTVSAEEAADARRLRIHRHAVSVGNGRDPTHYRPDPAARARLRAEFSVAQDRVVVAAVSRLVRAKGYPELVAAMRELPSVELWVAGERLASDRGADMDAVFAASGLGARLRRLGYREDIADILAAADIFALPSHFEGLPMSIIEAMLAGLPVVATDIRGPREQVVDGVTGLLVPRGEAAPLARAIGHLAQSPELRAAMGAAGRARALELYDERRVVERTLDLLGL